ncbi:MAG: fumarate hydratase [Clostridia bacterium]|nr:fumarate hydratase [Clostridia bacterium]
MRTIHASLIAEKVCELCISANKVLPSDLISRIDYCSGCEKSPLGKSIFDDMKANIAAAKELNIPVCQDTGMAVVFVEVGQDVHIEGGLLEDAINAGVHRGYTEGLLRCSVVGDPLRRVNTGDNTPAVIHTRLVAGDRISLTVAPKGFGSENMSRLRMFTPAYGRDDIIAYIAETVRIAGGNPCPPMVLGVGIGSDFEGCALLAKKALCRSLDTPNPDEYYRTMEADALEAVNATGVGPQGFGGSVTALAVNIEAAPTHIAGLPVAVNVGCHVTRHASVVI